MNISPLDGAFGMQVQGLDLRQQLSPQVRERLRSALHEHRILVLRDQHLSRDQYLRFGRNFGQPIPHVLDHMRMRGYPEMMTVGNTEIRDRSAKIRNGAALWHTDQSYEAIPAGATMLYSLIAPELGGETQFCDMASAYDALPAKTKAEIAEQRMAHKYGYGKRRTHELDVNPLINDAQDNRVPAVFHPLVMHHPATGRPALYALGHGAHGIAGMAAEAAETLIDELKDHVLQEQFIYRHKYRVGDLVIWDTLQTMHSATPIEPLHSRSNARLLWRISVRAKFNTHTENLSQ